MSDKLTMAERELLVKGQAINGIDFNHLGQYSTLFLLHAYFFGKFTMDPFKPLSEEIKTRLHDR